MILARLVKEPTILQRIEIRLSQNGSKSIGRSNCVADKTTGYSSFAHAFVLGTAVKGGISTNHGSNTAVNRWLVPWIDSLISDHTVQKEATRGMAATDRSLKSVYNLAEEARRSNLEIQKLFEEEMKSKKLIFYQDLAERNMSKSQIDALMTAYQSSAASNKGPGWTFHSDPPQIQSAPPPIPSSYRSENADQAFNTYRPEVAERALMTNPNRGNMGPKPSARRFELYVVPKDLPDRKT